MDALREKADKGRREVYVEKRQREEKEKQIQKKASAVNFRFRGIRNKNSINFAKKKVAQGFSNLIISLSFLFSSNDCQLNSHCDRNFCFERQRMESIFSLSEMTLACNKSCHFTGMI